MYMQLLKRSSDFSSHINETIIILYRKKTGTAMLDTEIPYSCETQEFHNHG